MLIHNLGFGLSLHQNDEPLWAEETCETLQQEAAEEAAAVTIEPPSIYT